MTSEKAPELLLCPFCGGEPEWRDGGCGFWISCTGCISETGDGGDRDRIAAAWNRRADAAQPTVGEMGDEIVRLTDRIQRHEGEIAAEIAKRDAMEEAFSKAYELVMGQPMEWSSAYNQAEALGDMEERLVADRASGGEAQAMVAAVLSEAVKKAELTFQDIGGGRRPPMPFEALLRDLEQYSQIMPSKARAQNVMRQAAKLLRALTPADASAALAERDNATWNAAIEAAAQVARDREAACTDWFKETRQHANVYEQLPIVASDIAALKREKPE